MNEFVKVDVLREERMLLDLVCTIDAKTMRGVASEQSGEDATCLGSDFIAKDQRVLKNLLVHHLGVLCSDPVQWT